MCFFADYTLKLQKKYRTISTRCEKIALVHINCTCFHIYFLYPSSGVANMNNRVRTTSQEPKKEIALRSFHVQASAVLYSKPPALWNGENCWRPFILFLILFTARCPGTKSPPPPLHTKTNNTKGQLRAHKAEQGTA